VYFWVLLLFDGLLVLLAWSNFGRVPWFVVWTVAAWVAAALTAAATVSALVSKGAGLDCADCDGSGG